ncbi:MAG: hypothetical protein QXD03_01980 [Candidatus Anstonellales archaeon]
MKHLVNLLKEIEIQIRSGKEHLSESTLYKISELDDFDIRIIKDFILRVKMNMDSLNFIYKLYDVEYPKSSYMDHESKDLLIVGTKRTDKDTLLTDIKNRLVVPNGISYETMIIYGMDIVSARNFAVDYALRHNYRNILFVDDDILAPNNALLILWEDLNKFNDVLAIGANYYKKLEPLVSAHNYSEVIEVDGRRYGKADKVLAMGFTLIRLDRVTEKVPPHLFWVFGSPDNLWSLGEDAFFTMNLIRYTNTIPLVDLDLECLHYDKKWKKVFGNFNPNVMYASGLIEDLEFMRIPPKNPLIVVCIPTKTETEPILCDFYKLELLRGYRCEFTRVIGYPVDEARNRLVLKALEMGADYILFVDSDIIPPVDGLNRLIDTIENAPDDVAAVISDYTTKGYDNFSATSVLDPEKGGVISEVDRSSLKDKDIIEMNWTTALGFSIIKASIFKELVYPWFRCVKGRYSREDNINEDTFFSEMVYKSGRRILMNRTVRCLHVDLDNRIIYYFRDDLDDINRIEWATSLDFTGFRINRK